MLKNSMLYVVHIIHNYKKRNNMFFCQSRDVDSQFCSCDASVFTVSHFRPYLPSVYEITVTLYVFVRRMILIYATIYVKCVNR